MDPISKSALGGCEPPLSSGRTVLGYRMADAKKLVLVGGVTGSIGSALAHRLKEAGWDVAGFSRSKLGAEIPEGVTHHEADAMNPESVERVFSAVTGDERQLDAYVHAIGAIRLKPLHLMTDDEWRETVDRNLTTAFHAARSALRRMNKQGSGSLVFISSAAAVQGLPSHEAVAAGKGGINGLVLSAAASYASRGIRVNAVAPGLVETNLSKPILATEQARRISERMHPLGRVGQPDEVASLIAWLVSEDASWVSGQIWSIDGGMAHLNQRPRA